MDRALDLETLTAAVGTHVRLPEPAELRQLLAETEIRLFTQQADIDERVLDTGWYLQAVATARADFGLYDLPRQRLAHQVSGHIFDLALQSAGTDLTPTEHLRLTLAAQVGYLGGELTPNAAALARQAQLPSDPYEWSEPGRMSLEAGVLVLALDRPALYPLLEARRGQLNQRRNDLGDLSTTPYGAVDGVIRGALALINYLTNGRSHHLDQAVQFFDAALTAESAESDIDSRWVAAHLLRISGDLASTSVWAVLPPDLPSAARAMTLGDPPVLSLWPPQLSFLAGTQEGPSPLDPETRRLVLSFPTSAGKTLLAQILIAAHVAGSTAGDVCVVAPTHSLCRELGKSLDRRLRILGRELHVEGPLGLNRMKPAAARVTVMTPEKLAALLRSDPAELLAQYAMFVIDEAHLVADPGRGWRLEETLSFLHYLTLDSNHRILVLSAALGSQSHFIQWMTAAGAETVQCHTDWRGPRRLHAIYSNEADRAEEELIPAKGRRLARRQAPLNGVIRLRTGASTVGRRFTEPVGTLVLRKKRDGNWAKDSATTTQRKCLVPLILHVAASGPVLVVQPTRRDAQKLAQEVAETINDESAKPTALVDLARTRLADAHPLTTMVGKGVAFHHAALPVDIQAEIEDAVRAGQIPILIATSTLIEGVNLPFKTVIVGRRGYTNQDGEMVELIGAPGLLNAVGRAGRAGRETEGWMILAEQSAKYSEDMFEPLQRTGDDLEIRSALTTEEALAGLATFEEVASAAQDAIFQHYSPTADGFLSFIWFVAQALEDLNQAPALLAQVLSVVENTLAWQQIDPEQQESLIRSIQAAVSAFEIQPAEQRARWARSGTSLPTAQALDNLAQQVLARFETDHELDLGDLVAVLAFILDAETLDTLLALGENNRRGFKAFRSAPSDKFIPVDIRALVLDWVSGVEIQELADRHLDQIDDEGYRSEALADFTASVFEHHLPWTLGIIIQWVNARLETSGSDRRVPDMLPVAVHYGVSTKTALDLMTGRVRSRRLANTVAEHAGGRTNEADEGSTLRDWLGDQTIAEWRQLFEASPTEVADLLSFARAPGAQVVGPILEGSIRELRINPSEGPVTTSLPARLEPQHDAPDPAPIQVVTSDGVAGTVRLADHDEVSLLMGMGIPLKVEVEASVNGPVVSVSLAPEPDSQ
ncbi:DEAD/DEAH box helicase [Candidatus Poriferisocius sp.]|uniref:DEAD/DEAH box helicase n=1 Tax=Candidatus Poriferisocius sp. TaxID=3101276 RepID=UPI003B01AA06